MKPFVARLKLDRIASAPRGLDEETGEVFAVDLEAIVAGAVISHGRTDLRWWHWTDKGLAPGLSE
jgi:hypothetical protein